MGHGVSALSAADLIALGALAVSVWAVFVGPMVLAIWRLATKVEKHSTLIERVIGPRLEEFDERLDDHEQRIRKVENGGTQ